MMKDNKVITIGTIIPKPIICKAFLTVIGWLALCNSYGEIHKPINHIMIADTNIAPKEYI